MSRRANIIADIAQKRTELRERLTRLQDYLSLFERRNEVISRLNALESEEQELQAILDSASDTTPEFEERISHLEEQFRIVLERFNPPRFPSAGFPRTNRKTFIDRNTYRPVVEGRRFDQLQSPGLIVLVIVAHALAHQLTAIEYDLPLPTFLLIDGVSNNLGREGLDYERLEAVYDYLIEVGEECIEIASRLSPRITLCRSKQNSTAE